MALLRFTKNADVKLSDHFTSVEFACPCSNCKETKIDSDLITKLEEMRKILQTPLRINSGYRCSDYQNELRARGYPTATGPSTHSEGRAADVTGEDIGLTGESLEKAARSAGFKAVGVGHLWVHVDLRADKDRRWVYATK